VATAIFLFIGGLIVVMEFKLRAITLALNPGFADKPGQEFVTDLAVRLTRILLPAQICFFLGGLLSGVLYSRKQFLVPALGPVIYNAGIILGALALRPWLGMEGLIWGAVGGAFIGNLLLPALSVRRLGIRFQPSLDVLHPAARKVWRMLLPIGLGVALPNIDQIVNKAFASLLSSGDITATMNSYRLMLLPIGVIAQAMALAVYPTLSIQAAQSDIRALRETMSSSLRSILYLTAPAAALMYLLATPIVAFLLQSGEFSRNDTLVTAGALRFFSLGVCAWAAQSLLTRGFYAVQNSRIPVVSGACVSVVFVAMNWAVVYHTHWGVMGLGAATSVAATIHAVVLLFLLRRRLGGIGARELLPSIGRTAIATIALGVAAWVCRNALQAALPPLAPKLHAFTILCLGSAAGAAAFLAVSLALHMPELHSAVAILRRRSRPALADSTVL
jgi:putative peptidoglycan lipid II flippase